MPCLALSPTGKGLLQPAILLHNLSQGLPHQWRCPLTQRHARRTAFGQGPRSERRVRQREVEHVVKGGPGSSAKAICILKSELYHIDILFHKYITLQSQLYHTVSYCITITCGKHCHIQLDTIFTDHRSEFRLRDFDLIFLTVLGRLCGVYRKISQHACANTCHVLSMYNLVSLFVEL